MDTNNSKKNYEEKKERKKSKVVIIEEKEYNVKIVKPPNLEPWFHCVEYRNHLGE